MNGAGGVVKSVDHRNYDSHIRLHEPVLDLKLECYYKSRSPLTGRYFFLWLGALGAFGTLVALWVEQRSHLRYRENTALDVLNSTSDCVSCRRCLREERLPSIGWSCEISSHFSSHVARVL